MGEWGTYETGRGAMRVRIARMLEMRMDGVLYEDIAQEMGYASPQSARQSLHGIIRSRWVREDPELRDVLSRFRHWYHER